MLHVACFRGLDPPKTCTVVYSTIWETYNSSVRIKEDKGHIKQSSAFACTNSPFAESSLIEIPFFTNHEPAHLITNWVGARGDKTKF